MEKQLHQEPGEVVRRPLPEIPRMEWDVFVQFAEEECSGNWSIAFSRLVRDNLIEPAWIAVTSMLESRLSRLESIVSSDKNDEKNILGTTVDGEVITDE